VIEPAGNKLSILVMICSAHRTVAAINGIRSWVAPVMMKILTFPDKLSEPGGIFFPVCVTYSEENSHRSLTLRRDGRVAEGARLESVFTRKGNVGSNPTLSAIPLNTIT
jgi:hypothetical protein